MHDGLNRFTIGQRKRHSLSGGPWFVVEKRVKQNELVVGSRTSSWKGRPASTPSGEPAPGALEGCTRYGEGLPPYPEYADSRVSPAVSRKG